MSTMRNKKLHPMKSVAVRIVVLLLAISLFIPSASIFTTFDGSSVASAAIKRRGVWVSFGDYLSAGLYNKSEEQFKAAADNMFKMLSEYEFNDVYFHVRAFNDAIYPTDNYKWCTYLSPKKLPYDALKILVAAAHKYKLRFHAWINPYRITYDKILNPGKKATIDSIVAGVEEIIDHYDVDGIHFDDYFYPSISKDNSYYKVSIKERKANVNKMVKAVYSAIKNRSRHILFGISPAGNIEYAEEIGCDLKAWLSEDGYVDYIVPQIYWSNSYHASGLPTNLFTERLDDWTNLCNYRKPMYIGLGLYRAGSRSSADRGWMNSSSNIAEQYEIIRDAGCDGLVMFAYADIVNANGKKEFANYMKQYTGLRLTKRYATIKRYDSYSISKYVSIKKKYRKKIRYSSSKIKVAYVSNKGLIKGRKKGKAQIHVIGLADSTVTFTIRVK